MKDRLVLAFGDDFISPTTRQIEKRKDLFVREYKKIAEEFIDRENLAERLIKRVEDSAKRLENNLDGKEETVTTDLKDVPLGNDEDMSFVLPYFSVEEIVLIQLGLQVFIDPGHYVEYHYRPLVRIGFLAELERSYHKAHEAYFPVPSESVTKRDFQVMEKSRILSKDYYERAMALVKNQQYKSDYYYLLELAAEEENLDALFELGRINYEGLYDVKSCKEEGRSYLFKASSLGSVRAMEYLVDCFDEGDEELDGERIFYLCERGKNQSDKLLKRLEKPFDFRTTEEKYLERAKIGESIYLFRLYELYLGRGDEEKAALYLSKAVDAEQVDALLLLGDQAKHKKDKLYYYKKAANQHHVLAMYRLANLALGKERRHFYEMKETDKLKNCHIEEFRWYQRAKKEGDKEAETYEALAFHQGYPIGRDDKEAYRLAKHSASEDNPFGEYVYGMFLEKGIGTEPDLLKAVSYYEDAAEKGILPAIERLYQIYHDGCDEILKDEEKSLRYRCLAGLPELQEEERE